ncbi:MAG: GNAT family N-acetyltransferase [Acidimicrobiales bacterium]
MNASTQIHLRRSTDEDRHEVVDVCRRALRWADGDRDAAFFQWKHFENPFGASPVWVAVDDVADEGQMIVGVRAMMRWQLAGEGGRSRSMARAVDTATLPSHQGQGIFKQLTLAAVDELASEGTEAIFNTPNDQSRPGYLKMNWEEVGRVPIVVRPRSLRSLGVIARSRVAAEKWGEPTTVGISPTDALADADEIDRALTNRPPPNGWSTPLSVGYLRWRTGFEPLACRIEPLGTSLADGFVVFRIRKRGPMRQLSVLHVVSTSRNGARATIRSLMDATNADLAMASGQELGLGAGMIALPAAGPILTWRRLGSDPSPTMNDLALQLGTIELF